MNISSIIATIKESEINKIRNQITIIEGCDIALVEQTKLVITIEAENIDEETKILKLIEKIDGVLSVKLAYSYSEEELEQEREKISVTEDIPRWLNNDNVNARDIPYTGKLKI